MGFSKELFSEENFKEYVTPLRTRIGELEEQIRITRAEETLSHDGIFLPSQNEIEVFERE